MHKPQFHLIEDERKTRAITVVLDSDEIEIIANMLMSKSTEYEGVPHIQEYQELRNELREYNRLALYLEKHISLDSYNGR